jgi:BirA family transcriptional regulator, biotin operon repressor / biotin---[acetyl-CoA-carboxylase] ligase
MTAKVRLPSGYNLRSHTEIDSTNEEARRLAANGEAGPTWIVTERQTAGRGRRGRNWVSPVGNLMCTLLLRPKCSPAKAAELSFVAGLAIHDAATSLMPETLTRDVALKWPNDLLIGGKKASGILLESESDGGAEVAWLAVGIGLNLLHFPGDTPYPATSISASCGEAPSIESALEALASSFEHWIRLWQVPDGFETIRREWLKRAQGVGKSITVRLSDETIDGTFEGLANDGALQLKLNDGTLRPISAGDVFFGSTGGAG